MPDIGLQAIAEQHFGFLVSERSYRLVESTPHLVRFESASVYVEIVYDGERSYELGLLVGLRTDPDPPFSIHEVLRLRRAPEAKSFALIQITTAEGMVRWIDRLAVVFRTYGDDLISGTQRGFVELSTQRRDDTKRYALERELRSARAEAANAWRSKDYVRVVKIFGPLRDVLTAAERGILEFSEKRGLKG